MKACIKHGYPFVFGFTVLTSFSGDVAKTGNMVMPQPGDKVRGGHAVTAVGYDDFKQCFIVRCGCCLDGEGRKWVMKKSNLWDGFYAGNSPIKLVIEDIL